jgi:hypothetical protein
MRDSLLYGQSGGTNIVYDEAAQVARVEYTAVVPPSTYVMLSNILNEPVPPSRNEEAHALGMLDMHEEALSADRDLFYFNRGGR